MKAAPLLICRSAARLYGFFQIQIDDTSFIGYTEGKTYSADWRP
jgi:hypothetical protein